MSERSRWIVPIALGAAGVAYVNGRLRPRGDAAEPLPGDELLPDAEIVETHETVLQAPVADVWPWLVQMGYGRGGFYTFDALCQLVGVGISSADVINPAWQNLTESDSVHLAENISLVVARLEPERCLILSSEGGSAPAGDEMEFDFTWAFVLTSTGLHACRLTVRERYVPQTPAARRMLRTIRPVARLMTHGMFHGMRRRTRG
ncbi:hypothetical protein [Actinomyces succiniciruminis]|uniref:Ketopantoate hydroxymethyltransferase n=1 Tax=Actinomyces succiniciruminis TaxID=1522002 RepID=A0A1L7RMM1_9ACTO|nr:hypothetical protein [Actinomyces succiniciruminis]CED90882.1 Ketopantoate hydroxymethyltransferase [Actinomyces succiniciruminis]